MQRRRTVPERATRALMLVLSGVVFANTARGDELASRPLERRAVEQNVLAHHPEVHASEARARAARASVDAEGRLPSPEAMVQVWQVPLEKPYAVDRAGMIMLGLTQRFPAPGALAAREEAKKAEADAAETMISDRARMVAREAGHAFVEYAEATERRRLHAEHEQLEKRLLELTRARHSTGGSLAEAVRAEAELARTEAELVSDVTRARTARTQLNVLLGRPLEAPLGEPHVGGPVVPTETVEQLVTRAASSRPEPKIADAERAAARSELEATKKEATLPSFSVSALYFVPTAAMNMHSYGVNAAVELPWLWGGGASRRRAQEARVLASEASKNASQLPIRVEVVAAQASVARSGDRLRVLQTRALPAGKRAVDVVAAGYESGGTPLSAVIEARRNLVDVQMAMVEARATLDHALVDLEAAVGAPVPTRPLSMTEETHHGN